MEFTEYVRKPFKIEAIEITEENISEVAQYVGDLDETEDGTPFIRVDRSLVPGIPRVYLGFFMTRMGDYTRCYSRRVFFEQFVQNTQDIQKWVDFLDKTTPGRRNS